MGIFDKVDCGDCCGETCDNFGKAFKTCFGAIWLVFSSMFRCCGKGLSSCWRNWGCCDVDFYCCYKWRKCLDDSCWHCGCCPTCCTKRDIDDYFDNPAYRKNDSESGFSDFDNHSGINPEALNKRAVVASYAYDRDVDDFNDKEDADNNAMRISSLLLSQFEYKRNHIRILDDWSISTEETTMHIFNEAMEHTKKGDALFLYLSGIGLSSYTSDNSEVDGQKEAFKDPTGQIITDVLVADILKKAPEGSKIFLVFDFDMSGTMANLPFTYNSKGFTVNNDNEDDFKAEIVCISACSDTGRALDGKNEYGAVGVLTETICQIMETDDYKYSRMTWQDLLGKINEVYQNLKIPTEIQLSMNSKASLISNAFF